MKFAVILNGTAGCLLGQPLDQALATVERLFEASGQPAEVTAASGAAVIEKIEEAIASDADVVVVGGGDGTVACAANRIIGTSKALGILPLGTLNLYAKDLNTPSDLAEAIPALSRGTIRAMDIGEVNGRYFLSHSSLGLYPLMVQEREATRKRLGLSKWPAMALAAVEALHRYPLLTVGLDLGEGPQRIVTPGLAVSNNRFDRGMGNFLHRSRLDGGELALYVAKHRAPLRMLRLMIELTLGTWQRDGDLDIYHLTEFTVTSRRRRLKVANDGEVETMTPPLHYRMHARALPVLVPATAPSTIAGEPVQPDIERRPA